MSPCGVTIVMTKELFLGILQWLGGGGVALAGVFLTSKKNKTNRHVGIINDLQEENRRKDERLDIQEEKTQKLIEQMDELRENMFKIQTDKHRSELKNIELQSKNENLEKQKKCMAKEIEAISKEKDEIKERFEERLLELEADFNKKIDNLIEENKKLRRKFELAVDKNNNE